MNAFLLEQFANICAINADIEGMKALNHEREQNDYALAYDETAFCNKAVELRNIAVDIHEARLNGMI
jgi:hypothetical protein